MRILFYDDDPKRQKRFEKFFGGTCEIIYAKNNKECLAALKSGIPFDVACLDHDMDGEIYQPSTEHNGWGIAKFISKMPEKDRPNEVVVHSMNEHTAPNMVNILNKAGLRANWFIFGSAEFRQVVESALAKYFGHDIIDDDEIIYSY